MKDDHDPRTELGNLSERVRGLALDALNEKRYTDAGTLFAASMVLRELYDEPERPDFQQHSAPAEKPAEPPARHRHDYGNGGDTCMSCGKVKSTRGRKPAGQVEIPGAEPVKVPA